MLSEHAARYAAELRDLLEAGVPARFGRVVDGHGGTIALDVAVRIALADLDHLAFITRWGEPSTPDGGTAWGEQLEYLHRGRGDAGVAVTSVPA